MVLGVQPCAEYYFILKVILMMKLSRYIICAVVTLFALALLCVGCSKDEKAAATVPSGKLAITLLEVNHGDTILLQDGKCNCMAQVLY